MKSKTAPIRSDIRDFFLRPESTIMDAITLINKAEKQLGLVVDEQDRLLGTVTDGDVRRAILKGCTLDQRVERAMFREPTTARAGESRERVLALMQKKQIKFIPLLDEAGRVVDLDTLDLFKEGVFDNQVVLMAGGLGKRLRPLTEDLPKPLIEVGGKPILELILESFIAQGFSRFLLTVNYKSGMIEKYFGDGSRWDVSIEYVHEPERLGTAGALSLLPERPDRPFIVMNADLLTSADFRQLLDFHAEQSGLATMCVREYDLEVPFGVVSIKDNRLTGIDEKPVHKFFVNAGIYVLEPQVLDLLPGRSYLDMTSLFEIIVDKAEAAVFPLREYWLDIGRSGDLERARCDVDRVRNGKEGE